MRLLLDTHLVIWAAMSDRRLPAAARDAIGDPTTGVVFSVISLWEIAIKAARARPDFAHTPFGLRTAALRAG